MKRACLGLALLAAACGDDPPVSTQLSLGPSYDVSGVARDLPDGMTPARLRPIAFRYDGMASSGGRLVGKLVDASGAEAAISGDFDPSSGDFTVEPLTFALTGTGASSIVELGGRGFDGTPTDRVVDDLSGFLRLEQVGARAAVQAYTIGSARSATAPAVPVPAKITARRVSLGRAQVTGAAGSILPRAGVELFVHGLAIAPPEFVQTVSSPDGAFTIELDASEGDVILVRARSVGFAGPATSVVVGP